MAFATKATIAQFGGKLLKLTHNASTTGCEMALNLYLPPKAVANTSAKVPVLFYLAGLTCTGDNGAEKGFFAHNASKKGIAVVFPDTSPIQAKERLSNPRSGGLKIQGEDDAYDFGTGAGFYINATADPWSKNYRMYDYITSELPKALYSSFPELDSSKVSIMGHSMGGHGALICYLKNPGMYKSVSAFSPIANPTKCPWGEKAFKGYFGEQGGVEVGRNWDATELIGGFKGDFKALIDVGTSDNFYKQGQLLPENLVAAAKAAGKDKALTVRLHDGYDHSYFFISTFADDHVEHAAKHLLD
ncbi:MAG: hypothetical protein M1818_004646 [Claussenomyces sp. TS43310]|nr:MAG: hypothetical protein M1818_004646 [Claussenomyces sp. TS43310]